MFTTSLLYVLLSRNHAAMEAVQNTGLMETASASASGVFRASFSSNVPVSIVSDPFTLNLVPSTPQYWIVLSMLGLMMMMFVLRWLSSIRK